MAKMMAKEPERRLQEPKEVAQAAAVLQEGGRATSRLPEWKVPRTADLPSWVAGTFGAKIPDHWRWLRTAGDLGRLSRQVQGPVR